MLTIRTTQLQTLGQLARQAFIDDMQRHVEQHFPALAQQLTADQLRLHVAGVMQRAALYQLTTQQQVCRFINLAATYGWEFDSAPDLLWMRNILTDTSLTQPAERLDRLVQTCLHRQSIEEHNRALRDRLGVANLATRPEQTRVENALSYRRSHSLTRAQEAAPAAHTGGAAPAWVNNAPSLLRRKSGAHDDL